MSWRSGQDLRRHLGIEVAVLWDGLEAVPCDARVPGCSVLDFGGYLR